MVGLVAGVFIVLGLVCALAPKRTAEMSLHLDVNKESSRRAIKRYPGIVLWTGRIVGAVFVVTGILILLLSRL